VGDKVGATDGRFVDTVLVGEAVGLGLGIIVLKLGASVGEKLGTVDGYGEIAVDGGTVGALVGNTLGDLLGSKVTGGDVGDTLGNEEGTPVGPPVEGDVVGIVVL